MKKIICDLDCSSIHEEKQDEQAARLQTKITHEIHGSRQKIESPDDTLVIDIVNMQQVLLQHVWKELRAIDACNTEIHLEDMCESSITFMLNAIAKKQTKIAIQAVEIKNVISPYVDEAIALIKRYADTLNQQQIPTTIMLKCVSTASTSVANVGYFKAIVTPANSPMVPQRLMPKLSH